MMKLHAVVVKKIIILVSGKTVEQCTRGQNAVHKLVLCIPFPCLFPPKTLPSYSFISLYLTSLSSPHLM